MQQQIDQPPQQTFLHPRWRFPAGVLVIACLSLLLHGLTNLGWFGYGYFRDELYYLACANHLDAGYVDHPPLSIWVLAAWRGVFGASLFALRALPALAGAGVILLTAWIARELGGGRRAQTLAALASTCAPVLLALSELYSMNAFEVLLWTGAAAVFIAMQRENRPHLWLAEGALLGLAMLNKHTAITFALALLVAVLVTPARRQLATRWPWLGLALAVLIVLPNLCWQVVHGFPSLEFYANAQALKNIAMPWPAQLLTLSLFANPVALPIWLAGLLWLLFDRRAVAYRPLGLVFLLLLAALLVSHASRADRLAGAFPMLFAAGAVALRQLVARLPIKPARVLAVLWAVLLVSGALVALPTVVPILPAPHAAVFAHALGMDQGFEQGLRLRIPQILADRFGWPELVASVARVYGRLSPEEQRRTLIFTANYGQAGAIDLLGRQHRLPTACSGHNNYFLWGTGHSTGDTVIAVGISRETLEKVFAEVQEVEVIHSSYAIENGTTITLARHPNAPLQSVWPRVKVYR